MEGAECIILVPGLFGFSKIGGVSYFSEVKKLLSKATKIKDITAIETPPTGPLWRRVDAVHRCVVEKVNSGASRIHLVGHSTGGVDVRLLTNSRYLWPGGPTGKERTAFFKRIGSVISISAPHRGTPIARRLRGSMEQAVTALYVASFVAKHSAQDGSLLKEIWDNDLRTRLARSAKAGTIEGILKEISAAPRSSTREILDFFGEIVDDHQLIHELTPHAMDRLNARLGGADVQQVPLSTVVTVAPPPRIRSTDLFRLSPARRALYSLSYVQARLEPDEFGALPTGRWIDEPPNLASFARTAQDGVVPAASQTLTGEADLLVFADHLDVVGHYRGVHGGVTLFDSGAAFDDTRMEELWTSIGNLVSDAPARRSNAA